MCAKRHLTCWSVVLMWMDVYGVTFLAPAQYKFFNNSNIPHVPLNNRGWYPALVKGMLCQQLRWNIQHDDALEASKSADSLGHMIFIELNLNVGCAGVPNTSRAMLIIYC